MDMTYKGNNAQTPSSKGTYIKPPGSTLQSWRHASLIFPPISVLPAYAEAAGSTTRIARLADWRFWARILPGHLEDLDK